MGVIQWGDAPTWVAAVGTVGTLVATTAILQSERRDRQHRAVAELEWLFLSDGEGRRVWLRIRANGREYFHDFETLGWVNSLERAGKQSAPMGLMVKIGQVAGGAQLDALVFEDVRIGWSVTLEASRGSQIRAAADGM